MTRQWRIGYEGALYHVLSRGNEGRDIFADDNDRKVFVELLGRMCHRFSIELYAYVLMNNHFHLLLKTPQNNLSKSMQWFIGTYTRFYNIQWARSGHLFQGRFKSFLVENDAYLLQLSYYIHRNPLRAGMVRRLADYRWSSYRQYAYNDKIPHYLNTSTLLSLYSAKNKHGAYRRGCQEYAREEKKIWEDVKHGILFGSEEFIETIRSRFVSRGKASEELPQQKKLQKNRPLSELLQHGAALSGIDIEKVSASRRVHQADKLQRDILLYAVVETGLYTNAEIGAELGLTGSAVSRRTAVVRAALNEDKTMRKKINTIKSLIKV
jgi:putative transposase